MRIRRFDNAISFLDAASDWLLQSEAEHNLLLGVARQLEQDDHPYERPIYLATVEDGAETIGRFVSAGNGDPADETWSLSSDHGFPWIGLTNRPNDEFESEENIGFIWTVDDLIQTQETTGTSAMTLPILTSTASGKLTYNSTSAQTLPLPTMAATGKLTHKATSAQTIPLPTMTSTSLISKT